MGTEENYLPGVWVTYKNSIRPVVSSNVTKDGIRILTLDPNIYLWARSAEFVRGKFLHSIYTFPVIGSTILSMMRQLWMSSDPSQGKK